MMIAQVENTYQAMKDLYLREHYLPITSSGGLEIAKSEQELIDLINNALSNPERLSKERENNGQRNLQFYRWKICFAYSSSFETNTIINYRIMGTHLFVIVSIKIFLIIIE